MSDMNTVAMTGRLGADAIFKTTDSGYDLCEFNLANGTGFGTKARTTFYKCAYFGKGAKGVTPYLTKGVPVGVTGVIYESVWQAKDGTRQKSLNIDVKEVTLLSGGNGKVKDEGYPVGDSVDHNSGEAIPF